MGRKKCMILFCANRGSIPGIRYFRNFPREPRIIVPDDDESLWKSELDLSLKTIIFFHGFVGSYLNEYSQDIKDAYLDSGHYNVILVQSERLLAGPSYFVAVDNCKKIAQFSARFIDYLVDRGLDLEKLHLMGLSLGAHIAGMTGQFTTRKLSRITGFDPAGPLFNNELNDEIIDSSDAEFVDIIFTNYGRIGMGQPVGHINFFPNGGVEQPGCSFSRLVARYGVSRIHLIPFCHHFRSYQLYIESIKFPTKYPSKMCDSYADYKLNRCYNTRVEYMGIATDPTARGNYYLDAGEIEFNMEETIKS